MYARCQVLLVFLCSLLFLIFSCPAPVGAEPASNKDNNLREPSIHLIQPDPRGGEAYKLVYFVNVSRDIYWKFKTDFDNDFLTENEFIKEHRFVSRRDNVVVTEEKYALGPDASFRWQTRIYPELFLLEFSLLNPEECGQKFHYGYIYVQAKGTITRITQVAYFDFFGASLWAHYPWSGGLKEFLRSTALWEQKIIKRLKNRYAEQP